MICNLQNASASGTPGIASAVQQQTGSRLTGSTRSRQIMTTTAVSPLLRQWFDERKETMGVSGQRDQQRQ